MEPEFDPPYSHPAENGRPAVLLLDHLHDVRDRVATVVPIDATTPAGDPLADVIQQLALVHDFGKATTWFQQHIGVQPGTPSPERKRYHAPLGAFAAYYVLRESGHSTETCLAGFVAVAKHHGRLPDVAEYVRHRSTETTAHDEHLDVIAYQVENIHTNAREFAQRVFEEATGRADAWRAFAVELAQDDTLFEEIADLVTVGNRAQTAAVSEKFYGLVLEAWGTLVLADKTSAAGAPDSDAFYDAVKPSRSRLDSYVADLEADAIAAPDGTRRERLNHFRSRARTDVLESVPAFVADEGRVATITLPTGMGKTLTGISAALAIRDATGGDRVVYALPFTSIIDQVAAEVRDIFSTSGGDGVLAIDHHLSDTRVDRGSGAEETGAYDDADQRDQLAAMLGESWRAGLTVTTFVQLFESLAGPRNTQSMKLPSLRGSVVVLDEPQSLPLDWWKLVPRLVDVLTEQYDATVIAMTATQPELFPGAVQLVDDVDEYFAAAERVRYRLHDSVARFLDGEETPLDNECAADNLAAEAREGTAILAICNTIDSARRLSNAVTDRLDVVDVGQQYLNTLEAAPSDVISETVRAVREADGRPFVHLSTRLRPKDRLALIQIIKNLRGDNEQVVAVTTQLVEAGVDISFEAVYRDLAPIDSIVQAAGRCNRSFEQEYGVVTVWWLAAPGEQNNTPGVAVYDRSGEALLPVTAAALDTVRSDANRIAERSVARDAVEDYYERLHEDKDVGRANYVEYVDLADADALARLSLIDSALTVDVIVCVTDDDDRLVDDLEAAYDEYEFERSRELLDETKPLRISVPIYDDTSPEAKQILNLPPLGGREDDADVRILRSDDSEYDRFFDATTGFVIPDPSVEDRFL